LWHGEGSNDWRWASGGGYQGDQGTHNIFASAEDLLQTRERSKWP
jgi:hypothetical protein